MTISEPSTLLTDYLLAAVAFALGARLWAGAATAAAIARRLWAAAFLTGPHSLYITGTDLLVDGGQAAWLRHHRTP